MNFDFTSASLEAMYDKYSRGDESSNLDENKKKFFEKSIEEVQKNDLVDKFMIKIARIHQLEGSESVIAAQKKLK